MEIKNYFSNILKKRTENLSEKDKTFKAAINKLTGYKVNDLSLFKEAFTLKSQITTKEAFNYERLEYLGDAVLGSIVSCYIFHEYPHANEGFLTQMKSKVVNRKNLNALGERLGLTEFLQNKENTTLSENIQGNLFEALVGAIYQDVDYDKCREIVLGQLLTKQDILNLENKIISYKGLLLEWGQKQKINLRFETSEENYINKSVHFRSSVWIEDKQISNASEASKKKAEEKAAQRAYYALQKKENINGENKKNTP
ncbi:ribonuclease III [Elizabethkingia argentiflava]|uniref:Ribonuclease 3 n=1 Tax=Elizabethkingia argenteiflava TaxID=2681556 RepID=A0A845PUH7_9FLAO|nr:ribonuclease III domain-containing protein [Elizabethkingia argenteiflava]NAW51305.1 ribonuclease III [Elizabethkingia argenteiflava]